MLAPATPADAPIVAAVTVAWTAFLASTMILLVLGSGPVPTFAPPYVPVGPVVGGICTRRRAE